jgi:hypothetical protein
MSREGILPEYRFQEGIPMPWREATFWIGLTVFGTGLSFVIDHFTAQRASTRMLWLASAISLAGLSAVGYSMYSYNVPTVPKLPVWLYLLILTWGLIGWDYYDRRHVVENPAAKALLEIAKEDAEKIRERVRPIQQHIEFYFQPGSDPHIDVVKELLNVSVWTVVTYGEIQGQTMYAGRQLAIAPQVFDKTGPPGVTCLTLKHADSGGLIIRQFVSMDMADRMWADRLRNIAVDMSLVGVKFKILLPDTVRDFVFYGPRFTIDEARRL